jgi:hypothetical protein
MRCAMVVHPPTKSHKKQRSNTSEPEPEPPDQATRHQDSYRRVVLGQISDPIFPSTSLPPAVPEDELTSQAMEDRGARKRDRRRPMSTLWRWLFLVILGAIALGIVLVRKP